MTPKCNICGQEGAFINQHRSKEGRQCANCSASSRNRAVMHMLGCLLGYDDRPAYAWPQDKSVRILEPCPRGPQVPILRDKFDYYEPEFDLEKIQAGADPREYATVEHLGFEDDYFDYVIASEIFEHVRHDRRGFAEVYRTLKRDGVFIFTSPYSHEREKTFIRVKVDGDRDIPLVQEKFAGGGGATLDYREYGRDVLEILQNTGFSVGYFNAPVEQYNIAAYAVILCQKSPFLHMSNFLNRFGDSPHPYASLGYLLPNRLFVAFKWNLKNALQFWREAKRKIN